MSESLVDDRLARQPSGVSDARGRADYPLGQSRGEVARIPGGQPAPYDAEPEQLLVPVEEERLPALEAELPSEVDRPLMPPPLAELPGHAVAGPLGILSFIAMVIVPLIGAAFYYYALASDQYVSQFRFMVTQSAPATLTPQMGTSTSTQGISSMMGALGVANLATAQNYIVSDYLSSPQAVQDLESRIKISRLYSRPGIDFLSRFDPAKPVEQLTRFWQGMLTSRYDPITGIATADVRAFTAADAKLIATTLVTLSEDLVNRIDMRAKLDAVRFAETEVQRAEDRMKAARAAVTDFRNKEGVIDPTASIVPGNIQDIATTRASLIQLQTELDTVHKQHVAAGSPIESSLQARIAATQGQLTDLERQVAKDRGSNAALSNVVGRYEQLDLDRQYANSLVVSAMQALDQARVAAGSQDLYLTPYVSPSLPESSTYPLRLQSVALFGLVCVGVWVVVSLLYRAVHDR